MFLGAAGTDALQDLFGIICVAAFLLICLLGLQGRESDLGATFGVYLGSLPLPEMRLTVVGGRSQSPSCGFWMASAHDQDPYRDGGGGSTTTQQVSESHVPLEPRNGKSPTQVTPFSFSLGSLN